LQLGTKDWERRKGKGSLMLPHGIYASMHLHIVPFNSRSLFATRFIYTYNLSIFITTIKSKRKELGINIFLSYKKKVLVL
jgi:hypothetical protein